MCYHLWSGSGECLEVIAATPLVMRLTRESFGEIGAVAPRKQQAIGGAGRGLRSRSSVAVKAAA
jgi:hypothetical protein